MSHIHVVGAGLAGLAAALSLTGAGRAVTLHEAGPAAGGRCRSYFDRELGLRIDNGNHLMLSGNGAVCGYLSETGAWDRVSLLDHAALPFVDVRTGERWVVRPNAGRVPWWVFHPGRRVPGTRLAEYAQMARIARVLDSRTVADCMSRGQLYQRLMAPIAIAALNTPPEAALVRLLGAVMRETLMRGGAACRPLLPKEGLSEALVDPALAVLRGRGATVRLNHRIAELVAAGGRITALRGPAGLIPLEQNDAVVLAVPPWVAAALLPGLVAPDAFEAILNIHFRFDASAEAALRETGFLGVTSGTAEWVFRKQGHVSVTISAANRLVDEAAAALAEVVWGDVVDALALDGRMRQQMPPWRVVKEKRATFAATAEQDAKRPRPQAEIARNLALAGDWVATGLPATIEGAIRSGRAAARLLLSHTA